MTFQLVGISSDLTAGEDQLGLGSSGPVTLGQVEFDFSPLLGETVAGLGARLVGVCESETASRETYLILEGEIDSGAAETIASELDMGLLDFRTIIFPGEGPAVANETIRTRLEAMADRTVAIGPELDACPECGGFDGLHFSPPHVADS